MRIELDSDIEDRLARHPAVQVKVSIAADQGAWIARGKLARHRKTGNTHITVETSPSGVDRFINMVGDGAAAIEWGHVQSGWFDYLAPDSVKGLHILGATRMEMKV